MTKIFIYVLLILSAMSNAQTLLRKASVGILTSKTKEGLRIDSVVPNSSADLLKLKKNDLILSVNGKPVTTPEDFKQTVMPLRTGDLLEINFVRDGKNKKNSGKTIMRPMETSNFADITYDWVKFREGFLRVIVRKPKSLKHMPCILLIPGYGCGSIENYHLGYNGTLMNEWLKNGYAVVTIEKSGLGDSYNCPPCTEVDLVTDIESFNAGYNYMEQLDFVEKDHLYIWGHSMGGVIAPEIARRHKPRGVMVFGTVFRPWSEFLPEMHRVQKPLLENMSYEETEKFVRLIHKVYYEFFVLKKSRQELFENPEYTAIVRTELEHKEGNTNMWGRHWRFWQQLDSLDLSVSWSETKCPVLVINGGSDYEQCAPIEPVLIEQTVNSHRPGSATRVQIEDLDHFMMKSNGFKEAVENFRNQAYSKGNFNYKISTETIQWLNKQQGKS
ncbi:MAG: alpha/beta fold hydrolase [Bacteroidia bacterium]|nr:alpha/beta fold hydrolase [Bacteroidia bacterium]